ncbi:hypothetical protein [Staphylococcus xylosus]|uniref:hypothetical protein n=1 Tax=Staphylococcus xylosus TaxID=1288 RepID=UPI000852A5DA|nr:hypothetical protein [Staphylococcus xylosus]MCA2500908.1 hypothetical protein [Staphylococcus xylosus]MCA2501689.1 hypothetical protein [Staphylococcus xylosus]MCE7780689.1 hypothetical protein [Staphylococcus xylosus]MCM3517932.1 hypothetical protein [Staphylococcus xylosus]MDW8555702.1 hypothetical protein [Staphylococcus xylosus]
MLLRLGKKVKVIGTAKFNKNNELLNVVEACKVYIFEVNKVIELKLYCIPLDKEVAGCSKVYRS